MKRKVQLIILVTLVVLSGCGGRGNGQRDEVESREPERVDTGFVLTGPNSYDSADTAILTEKNKKENRLTFLNLNRGRYYTLEMDGTTHLYDKYGESISLDQIFAGDIVDITFLKDTKHLTSMKLSSQAWKNEGVARYTIDYVRGEVTIGEDIYKLTDNTRYLSMGNNIEKMDLNAVDVLNFQGIGNQVLSVSVEKGHGYLRLLNDENFVGGWIEVGQTAIQPITEDMLMVVPEGSYQVNISHRGGGGVKDVVIHRNEETALDIGDLEVAKVQTGMVLFSISPSNAKVYIDSIETDVSEPVTLEYGIHQLIVKADGYKSITQYIRVAQASVGINVVLESMKADDDDEKKDTDTATSYYKVHVDAPEGAEVYLDGSYMGVAPCSFKKTSGAHVITLRRSGYTTRSYTVQIDDEEKDVSYSFEDLVRSGSASSNSALDASSLVNEIIGNVLGG
ncbi:MAG: PEGA domain-containing protein [Butyrivibrio sp.]|nr:PEGA domain-containing protein [Muribaculum sp.]MCM1552053.1 PEGA domain-containing protein [Butyrivibrio sp.]